MASAIVGKELDIHTGGCEEFVNLHNLHNLFRCALFAKFCDHLDPGSLKQTLCI